MSVVRCKVLTSQSIDAGTSLVVWFLFVVYIHMICNYFWGNVCESVPLDHTGSYLSISMESTMYK